MRPLDELGNWRAETPNTDGNCEPVMPSTCGLVLARARDTVRPNTRVLGTLAGAAVSHLRGLLQ